MAALGNPQQLRLRVLTPGREPAVLTLVLSGRVAPDDVVCLGRHIDVLLKERLPRSLVCDVGALTEPDLATVDAVARLQLAARRHGCDVRLRRVPVELCRLLDLAGLLGVLVGPGSGGGALGQPEERKQPCGVEERVDPGDPAP